MEAGVPELSVIMPVFNGATTVETAVRSTLRAMPRDSELVVLDDASTDGTGAVVEAIGDRRVRLVRNSVNVGVGRAARELMECTDSRFVARMDADDVCLPWRFRSQLPAMRRGSVDILFAPVVRFRSAPLRVSLSMPVAINARASASPCGDVHRDAADDDRSA